MRGIWVHLCEAEVGAVCVQSAFFADVMGVDRDEGDGDEEGAVGGEPRAHDPRAPADEEGAVGGEPRAHDRRAPTTLEFPNMDGLDVATFFYAILYFDVNGKSTDERLTF